MCFYLKKVRFVTLETEGKLLYFRIVLGLFFIFLFFLFLRRLHISSTIVFFQSLMMR